LKSLKLKQKNIKVLVVDDEEDFANTLAQRLKLRDLKVDTAYDGEQALSKLKEVEHDVIVLDLKMPGMHGMEVLREIKKDYPDIQVIVITGHGTERAEEEARRRGGFDYLQKPADSDTLERRIKAAFKENVEEPCSIDLSEEGDLVPAWEKLKDNNNDYYQ
jgi:DNA-binding NtrC family response regulator